MAATITVTAPPAGKQVAIVSSPATSKINWTQIIGAAAIVGSYFGLNLDPPTQAAVAVSLGLATQGITWVLRTFFTNKQPSVG